MISNEIQWTTVLLVGGQLVGNLLVGGHSQCGQASPSEADSCCPFRERTNLRRAPVRMAWPHTPPAGVSRCHGPSSCPQTSQKRPGESNVRVCFGFKSNEIITSRLPEAVSQGGSTGTPLVSFPKVLYCFKRIHPV